MGVLARVVAKAKGELAAKDAKISELQSANTALQKENDNLKLTAHDAADLAAVPIAEALFPGVTAPPAPVVEKQPEPEHVAEVPPVEETPPAPPVEQTEQPVA